LKLIWVPSKENPADAPSRVLSKMDSSLHVRLQEIGPFSFDLMAQGSNVFAVPLFGSLPFYSEFPCLDSSGVNVFSQSPPSGCLYVYPPFSLIPLVLRLFLEWGSVEVVVVVPVTGRFPFWWALLQRYAVKSLQLCRAGDVGVVYFPSKRGFSPKMSPLRYGLSLQDFLCRFPPSLLPASPSPSASVKVIVVSDSMLRCLHGISWPHPYQCAFTEFNRSPWVACDLPNMISMSTSREASGRTAGRATNEWDNLWETSGMCERRVR
jgi:hypothetical protein